MRTILKLGFGAVLALLAVVLAAGLLLHEGRPAAGRDGAAADALARRIRRATGGEGWARTGAVSWDFAGLHQHLWDRARGLARVRWRHHEVLLNLGTRSGVAFEDGARVEAEAADELVEAAYAHWTNDAFWLDPFRTFRQDGARRSLARDAEGREGLLVRFTEGGVTPGDAYLWFTDDEGRPTALRMWVSLLPVGGLQVSWEGWETLSTGAVVSTRHAFGPLTLRVDEVKAAPTLAALVPGEDPFAALLSDGAPESQGR